MTAGKVTVLGAGNTGLSLAAQLALDGWEVLLWEHPAWAAALAPVAAVRTIALAGAGRTGTAEVAAATHDPAEACAWSDLLLASVPSYAHAPFMAALLPHLRPGQLLALLPGNLGTLAWQEALGEAGVEGVLLVEADTAPYVCRKTGPAAAVIWGVVPALGIGALPGKRTAEALSRLAALFPGVRAYRDVLECGLSALNPIVHPPGVLLNAGRIERSRGEFWFYEEGVTAAVARTIEALDAERRAIGRAYGYEPTPVAEAFHAAGFGPAGDLWATINGSRMLTALRAPGALETRWLTEDVPYGLATWAELGAARGVATPLLEALVTLASAVLGRDLRAERRGLAGLGLAGLTAGQVRALLDEGVVRTRDAPD